MRAHKNKKLSVGITVAACTLAVIVTMYSIPYVTPPGIANPPVISEPRQQSDPAKNHSASLPITTDTVVDNTVALVTKTPKQLVQIMPLTLPDKPALALRLPLMIEDQVFPNIAYKASATTNDPLANQPWENSAGVVLARDQPTGSYVPKVAVIDSGIALKHQDLAGLWLVNNKESGITTQEAVSRYNCSDRNLALNQSCNNLDDNLDGTIDNESGAADFENMSQLNCSDQAKPLDKSCNNIDDDSNQLIDDYQGYDFINNDRSVIPGETDALGQGVSHGTLITGIIAAKNNNHLGTAGVSSNAQILPLQALADDGSGYTLSIADAIYYAVSRDVDIINLSLGTSSADQYIKQAIEYANREGVTVVAAAGNDGCECNTYPAAFSAAIAVGASQNNGSPAAFSNRGSFVDLLAPGVNLTSTSWSDTNGRSLYEAASGTSLSTPVISGALARLLSYNANASPLQLKALLYEQTNRTNVSGTRDVSRGFGLVNLSAAARRVVTPLASSQLYSFYAIRSGRETDQSWGRRESNKPLTFYSCEPASGTPGTTVFELERSGNVLYSASEADKDAALASGYGSKQLANWCVVQDVDATMVRSMNIYAELRNDYTKR